jgi:hypothetical protein
MKNVMIGGIEYETHALEKIVSGMVEQVLYKNDDNDALFTDES